jgi:hypothetical protein
MGAPSACTGVRDDLAQAHRLSIALTLDLARPSIEGLPPEPPGV